MKIGTQVYVRNSMEAVETYCKAFGAEITFKIIDEEKNVYEHCELSVDGQGFLAASEAPESCDAGPKTNWQTMAFNVYEMGEEAVRNAYAVLKEGGTVIDELGPCPWNPLCSNLIDKYGVFWWIAK